MKSYIQYLEPIQIFSAGIRDIYKGEVCVILRPLGKNAAYIARDNGDEWAEIGIDGARARYVELTEETKFSHQEIAGAFEYWKNLTHLQLVNFWLHYTTGAGAGIYTSVSPEMSFLDYMVSSAMESSMKRAMDI